MNYNLFLNGEILLNLGNDKVFVHNFFQNLMLRILTTSKDIKDSKYHPSALYIEWKSNRPRTVYTIVKQ